MVPQPQEGPQDHWLCIISVLRRNRNQRMESYRSMYLYTCIFNCMYMYVYTCTTAQMCMYIYTDIL